VRRVALYVVAGSVVVNAVLGVVALLAGDFGRIEARVLFTSLCVSGASILSLGSAPAWRAGRLGPVPPASVAAAIAGFGLVVVGIWREFESETIAKAAWTLLAVAVAGTYAGLLVLVRLSPRLRWAQLASFGLDALLAAMIVSAFWGEWDSEWFARLLGVVAVLLAAFSVLVPVLGRISRGEAPAGAGRVEFCPRCGAQVSPAEGEAASCPACSSRFAVRFL